MADKGLLQIRCEEATRDRYYELYHRWAVGRKETDHGTFLDYLIEKGGAALDEAHPVGVRVFDPNLSRAR